MASCECKSVHSCYLEVTARLHVCFSYSPCTWQGEWLYVVLCFFFFFFNRWWLADSICLCIYHLCASYVHVFVSCSDCYTCSDARIFFFNILHYSHLLNFVLKCTKCGHPVMVRTDSRIGKKYDADPMHLLEST